ncbi:MAG: hypothetical protein RDU20_17165 [Desulfomonilaceae bacterium]|nr:hypothetical protein [Desulfomonilaceae bacterium]
MSKPVTILATFLVLLGFGVLPALALEAPVVTLERVDVASIQPFYVKPIIGKDDKGEPKTGTYGYSSTLNLAYIFNIKNPNKEPVMLDELQFSCAFDDFEVNTAIAYEDSWIPAGKTNQVRVIVTNEAFPTVVSLMVGAEHAARIQEMKTSAGALVKKWFETVSDFTFPIGVTNGTALFKDEKGNELRSTFSGVWGKKAEAAEKKK